MNKKTEFLDLGTRGRYNTNNKLNDLTGKEWLKFTKSWFIHRPPRRKENEVLHPAKFPEEIHRLIGLDPPLPVSLMGLDDKPEIYGDLPNNYADFRAYLLENFNP